MKAEIGIIGGSGFYSLLENAESSDIETEYGKPSDRVSVGKIGGRDVAFIPRHGSKHTIPPHMVPYRANIEALHMLGVNRIIATGAVGSLNPEFRIGEIVLLDQFVNLTYGRKDTFYDADQVAHVSTADPYCDEMRAVAARSAEALELECREKASVLVVNGPRFSTKAESRFFSRQGFDLINMTQYPEVALARERCICYIGIAMVTDYDAGIVGVGGPDPVSYGEVTRTFAKSVESVKALAKRIVVDLPSARGCRCGSALDSALAKA